MRLRRCIALALGLMTAGAPLGVALAFAESVINLRVNGEVASQALIVRIDEDGALLLRADDLASLRLKTPSRGLMLVNGERYFRFANGEGAQFEFDAATQSGSLQLPASAFLATRSTASPRAKALAPTVSLGGFVNYDVSVEDSSGQRNAGAFIEAGMFGRHGVVTSTALARTAESRLSTVRLDTTFTHDMPDRLSSLRIGDAINATGAWGRAARFAGVQYATNFATQPTLVTTPLLSASGEAIVPSTVDVFVNGQRVASESVPPGPFAIDRVPAINGAGQMQVVVTDALGRQQVVSQNYYMGASLLQPGLDQYSFELGAMRRNYAEHSFDYGDWVAAATWRRGLSDALTMELHGEGDGSGAYAAGLDSALRLGRYGVLTATAAAGGDRAGDGWLGGLGLEHSGRTVSLFARTQYQSRDFAQLGSSTLEERLKSRSFGGVGLNLLRYGALQLAWGLQEYWNSVSVESLGLSYSLSLGPYGFLSLFSNHSVADDRDSEVQLSWTLPFGARRSVSASLRHGEDSRGERGFEAVASLQQNLPVGSGSGYQVNASTSEDFDLGYAYQGHAGQLGVDYASRNGASGARVGALGGLAITSAGLMPSRTLDASFAVVKVADYENLIVYVDNQPVGKTDRKGRVLLDGLRPYELNEVSIDPNELPMDASLSKASIDVTPAFRSGAVVEFPIRRASAVTFHLVQENGHPVPAGTRVTTQGVTVPVAHGGLVYLEYSEGRQEARAEWGSGRCSFVFVRGRSEEPVPDLGNITCRAQPR